MKKIYYLLIPVAVLILGSCNDDKDHPNVDLDISKIQLTYTKAGGDLTVNIVSSKKWTISIKDEQWLSASTLAGEGSAVVTFTADPYRELQKRTNLITISTETLTKEINVTQDASEPELDINLKTLSYNYQGGTELLEITANTPWELVIEGKDKWVTFYATEGEGDTEVNLTVPAYWGDTDRNATITLKSVAGEVQIKISQTFPKTLGVWIMSQGGALAGGADLAYYDYETEELKTRYFSELNGESLGTVANHALVYGSRIYIAVTGPNNGEDGKIRVVDYKTGKLLETIPMKGPHGEGDLARQITAHDGKIYVTSYFGGGKGEEGSGYLYHGGVVKIDTTSLNIETYLKVGDKPEGIAYHNGKLLVCINESGNGNTMAIVDVDKFEVEKIIDAPTNPMYLHVADNGEIYLSTFPIYYTDPSALYKLDPKTYSATLINGAIGGISTVTDEYIYTADYDWVGYSSIANRVDRKTLQVEDIEIEDPLFMIYSIGANPATGEIYAGALFTDDVIFMNKDFGERRSLNVVAEYPNQFIPVYE